MCVEVQRQKLLVYLKLDPNSVSPLPQNARDVSKIGHFGTGDFELSVSTEEDVEAAKPYIEMAYRRVGG